MSFGANFLSNLLANLVSDGAPKGAKIGYRWVKPKELTVDQLLEEGDNYMTLALQLIEEHTEKLTPTERQDIQDLRYQARSSRLAVQGYRGKSKKDKKKVAEYHAAAKEALNLTRTISEEARDRKLEHRNQILNSIAEEEHPPPTAPPASYPRTQNAPIPLSVPFPHSPTRATMPEPSSSYEVSPTMPLYPPNIIHRRYNSRTSINSRHPDNPFRTPGQSTTSLVIADHV